MERKTLLEKLKIYKKARGKCITSSEAFQHFHSAVGEGKLEFQKQNTGEKIRLLEGKIDKYFTLKKKRRKNVRGENRS